MKKICAAICLVSICSTATAGDLQLDGRTLNFNDVVWSGEISNKFNAYKEYILTNNKTNEIGVVACNNSTTALGTNYAILTITDRNWSQAPTRAIQKISAGDCQKLMQAALKRTANIQIRLGNKASWSIQFVGRYLDMEISLQPKDN